MDAPPADLQPDWLNQLEERVSRAAEEIGRLRHENRRLEREVQRLRKAGAPSSEGAAAWERERAEVRGRVERLAQRLEELLGEGSPEAAALVGANPTAATEERPARPPVQRTLEPAE